MIRLRPSGVDEVLIKRVQDWYEPGPGVFIASTAGQTASFTPASLFTGSTTGVWYDPSDLTLGNMYQDSAKTTPVTAVEQPVGWIQDKSGKGNHAFQSNSANRPTLSARYNLYVNTETLATQNVTTVATSYKLTFTGSGSITLTGTATGVYTAGSYTISCTAGTLTSTVLGTVTQADLRVANDALNQPAYQRVNTSSDYNTVGFKPYLLFNGTSSAMQTNSIDFTATDKMFVAAGVRKLSDAPATELLELSVSYSTNNGTFAIFHPDVSGTSAFVGKGTLSAYYSPTLASAPSTSVLSMSLNIAGTDKQSAVIPRINGIVSQSGGVGTTLGTGNFGNYPLYIGARAGTSIWFNGRLYGLVVAGKQASASEITNTETYLNNKTGAF